MHYVFANTVFAITWIPQAFFEFSDSLRGLSEKYRRKHIADIYSSTGCNWLPSKYFAWQNYTIWYYPYSL